MTAVGTSTPLAEIIVRQAESSVYLIANRERCLQLSWRAADELYFALKSSEQHVKLGFASLLHEPGRVLVVAARKFVLDLEPRYARELAKAIYVQARKAEEHSKREAIALDYAVLVRAGVPLGLSNDPKVQQEAVKEAAWNGDLRRYMPGGIKSTELFGVPTVIVHPAKQKERHHERH